MPWACGSQHCQPFNSCMNVACRMCMVLRCTEAVCCCAGMCQHMLAWALTATANSTTDLLELYCGNGNFTIALAQNFRSDACFSCRLPLSFVE